MRRLLRRLWAEDQGAVISVELVLIISILLFGLIPGLVALRNSGIAVLTSLGNLAGALIPSFTFSGFQIQGNTSSTPVAAVSFGHLPVTQSCWDTPDTNTSVSDAVRPFAQMPA